MDWGLSRNAMQNPVIPVTLVQPARWGCHRAPQDRARRGAMSRKIGIWIDHKTAVIVSATAGPIATQTMKSEVSAHPRYSGQEGAGGEKNYEQRHGEQLDHYYDDIISQLGRPEAVLIFGPGEAKLELKERLSRFKALSECIVDLETADRLTEPQIVAKVKDHFGIAR